VKSEIDVQNQEITERKNTISTAKELIKKYEEQQMNVRNNREYDSLTKEVEFQNLEIELADKRIKEAKATIASKSEIIAAAQDKADERNKDLDHKKGELESIVSETRKDEEDLTTKSEKAEDVIEERLLTAYKRLRSNALNGLAVVPVEREACGGCFSSVPPQRQLDIRSHKKVIVCENCGRILVDATLAE
jgi:predicted  nucleic acid-binding Zn-ribbon protein